MNILKKSISFLLAAVLIFSFSACGRTKSADSYKVKKEDAVLTVSADNDNKNLFSSKSKDKLTPVAKSDMIELYFDKENCTVSVFDTASGKLWSSLPEKNTELKTSAISVTVLIGGNRYTLSSQSDSVGFSAALYEEKENGVTVNYSFNRTLEDGTVINLLIPVSYILSDGALTVEADCADIIGEGTDSDIAVTDIALLPFFGADTRGSKGDYIVIPDGCGAAVDLSENPDSFEDISLDIYESGNILGSFGMKSSDSAFAALIDEGSEIASVKMTKALSKGGCNSVYASFGITDVLDGDGEAYVNSKSYRGKLSVIYRFLSYQNADYIGMAGAVREMLIRKGKLLSAGVDESEEYPFNLSLVFENYVTDAKGKVLSQTLTTYEQAMEILTSLKAKGIEKINLRLEGVLEQKSNSRTDISDKPGKRKALDELTAYGTASGVSFYTDAGLIASDNKKVFSSLAVNPDGTPVQSESKVMTSAGDIYKNTDELISLIRDAGIEGICINDAGNLLYADCASGGNRLKSETADIISEAVASVSASKNLMVDRGNIYTVKYADVIINLPVTAAVQSTEFCSRIPFVQAILHGLVDYSVTPVNLDNNPEKAFLKAVEFGAIPYYKWYSADSSTEENTDMGSYLNYITAAQSQYEKVSEAFSDLRDARITDHYRVKKNVYCTQYNSSTDIYVNYNEEAVTVNGVTVDAMSFLRVN